METYLKVSMGDNVFFPRNFYKQHIIDTTITNFPNSGGNLLQKWIINCNKKLNNGKIQNIIESTEPGSPTGNTGATSLLPIGDSLFYVNPNKRKQLR